LIGTLSFAAATVFEWDPGRNEKPVSIKSVMKLTVQLAGSKTKIAGFYNL
jgi:hypothetical protein